MLAKRFFFVSAGCLCLGLAYHLAASAARAQAGGEIAAGNVETYGSITYYTCVVGRSFHFTPGLPSVYTTAAPVPGVEAIVATSVDGVYLTAMLANGDVYQWDGSSWLLRGNMVGGATVAKQGTWGQLKARYR